MGESAAQILGSIAHLLNRDVNTVFVDTTSSYWQVDDDVYTGHCRAPA